jgi:exodeoxyribonuclease-5
MNLWKEINTNTTAIPNEYEFFHRVQKREIQKTGTQDQRIQRKDLSKDQTVALDATLDLIKSDKALVSLGGYAGTGKTTLIPIISKALEDTQHTAFCAFTGKAANVLSRKLAAAGIHNPGYVGTIHRLIYQPETDEHGYILRWSRRGSPLVVGEHDNPHPIHRIILDEASMVNERILEDLQEYGLPILAVGDPGQLPPVDGISPISDPDFTLEQIHRQARDNPIIQLATHIRKGGELLEWEESKNIRFISQDDLLPHVGESYDRLGLNMGVLVRTNAVRQRLNTKPRDTLEPLVGDIVMCLKNAQPIFNGMRGVIEAIEPYLGHWYKATVYFPDDGMAVIGLLNRHQFGTDYTIRSAFDLQKLKLKFPDCELGLLFDFGLSMTVHKSQGSAFEEVFLCIDRWSRDKPEDYAKWLYTAVTRAEKKLVIVT